MLLNPYRFGLSGGGGGDPHWDKVALLLHGEGVGGSQVYIDSSSYGRTISESGSNQITTSKKKFGAASIDLFPSSLGSLSAADHASLELGSQDFCVEAWVCIRAAGINAAVLRKGFYYEPTVELYINSSLQLCGRAWNAAGTQVVALVHGTSMVIDGNLFTHVAFTREGGAFRLFISGVEGAEVTGVTDTLRDSAGGLDLGLSSAGSAGFTGFLDEVRFTIGAARYTADFSPPTAAFPDS